MMKRERCKDCGKTVDFEHEPPRGWCDFPDGWRCPRHVPRADGTTLAEESDQRTRLTDEKWKTAKEIAGTGRDRDCIVLALVVEIEALRKQRDLLRKQIRDASAVLTGC